MKYALTILVLFVFSSSALAFTSVQCEINEEFRADAGASLTSSQISLQFPASIFQETAKHGKSRYDFLNVNHVVIKKGILHQHFKVYKEQEVLEWIRHNKNIIDVRLFNLESVFQVRLDLSQRWPQKVDLLFSYSPYPNYGVQRINSVVCHQF